LSGWKEWGIGEVVEAAEFQSFVQDQTVQKYADAAARGSALGTAVAEGMISYLSDSNQVEVYDGSAWVSVGQDLTTGTQGFTALSNGTAGLTYQPVSHNYIINGAFDVNQRAFTTTTTSGAFGFDRFFFTGIDGTTTYSAQTFTPGAAPVAGYESINFARLVTTGQTLTSAQSRLRQRVEDVRSLAGQTATLSFWAKAGSGTPSIAANLAQIPIGSAGVDIAGQKATLSTSWARYSFTFTLPSLSGATISAGNRLEVNIWVSAGSDQNSNTASLGIQSNTFDIWGVQLEAGSVATPFKRHAPSLQGELAACQRYYYRIFPEGVDRPFGTGQCASTTAAVAFIPFPTTMRARPTAIEQSGTASHYYVTQANTNSQALSSIPAFNNATQNGAYVTCTVAANLVAGNATQLSSNNAAAFLAWSVEL
jgi:hypothetical protein